MYHTDMNPEIARIRADVIMEIRRFFSERNYLEVDTPLLSPHLIPESSIEVFASTYRRPDGFSRELYLIPSPEVWMKPLIAQGYGSLFQICKCFRNGEQQGRQHTSEFTMLEWYTVNSDAEENIAVTEGLFERMVPFGLPENSRPPFRRLSVDEACREYASFMPSDCTDIESISAAAYGLGISTSDGETWESIFNRIFIQYVEPNLPCDSPLILYDYPANLRCLARVKEDGLHRDRWELYAGGFECANCFAEETDASQVADYFRKEANEKKDAAVPHRIDTSWPKIYRRPHPPVSGVAMGVDRFLAVILGKASIDGVIFFPLYDIL